MAGEYIVRGLPASLAQDGWWLNCDTQEAPPSNAPSPRAPWQDLIRKGGSTALVLSILVALADWLFWGYAPGLSVALFSWSVFGAAALLNRPGPKQVKPALLMLLLTSLPIIEHYQALSLGFQFFGLIAALAWIHQPAKTRIAEIPAAAMHLLRSLPLSGIRTFVKTLFPKTPKTDPKQAQAKRKTASTLSRHARNWSFPLGGALVLITLLLMANPLLEQSLLDLLDFDLDIATLLRRVLFWCGTALMIWPLLVPVQPAIVSAPRAPSAAGRKRSNFGLNAGSVLRALIVFNLILGLQTIMDLSILVGGAALPEGMTLATYAHRGAYPLLITAMLAGGFALSARPYLHTHVSLTPLMMIWLGQNALLGASSVLRLDLYVASFGFTYLRLYAMIWIALVVTGLLLTAWQILKARSNRWLLLRCAGLGVGTLYLCAFVNFAGLIAAHNLSMKSTKMLDLYYLCTLGPNASSGIHAALNADPGLRIPSAYHSCWRPDADQNNWREWGFRSWRVNPYAVAGFDNTAEKNRAQQNEDITGR